MTDKYNSIIYKFFIRPVMQLASRIHWEWAQKLITGHRYALQFHDWALIEQTLERGYFIILTRKRTHLSTHLVALGHFLKTFKWGYWSHVLGNVEADRAPFRLVEATAQGVKYSFFTDVFSCDSVCILKPKHYSVPELSRMIDFLLDDIGKPYDDLFDMLDDQRLSCVEVWRGALMGLPDYHLRMGNFEAMFKKYKVLTPQMFYECPDFEVFLEIRR